MQLALQLIFAVYGFKINNFFVKYIRLIILLDRVNFIFRVHILLL